MVGKQSTGFLKTKKLKHYVASAISAILIAMALVISVVDIPTNKIRTVEAADTQTTVKGANTTTWISDIRIAKANSSDIDDSWKLLAQTSTNSDTCFGSIHDSSFQGNKKSTSDSVFVYYKTTTNPDEAIVDLSSTNQTNYHKVNYSGYSTDGQLAGGSLTYDYYYIKRKEAPATLNYYNTPMSSLALQLDGTTLSGYNFIIKRNDSDDITTGTWGGGSYKDCKWFKPCSGVPLLLQYKFSSITSIQTTAYLFYKISPYSIPNDVTASYDGKSHRGTVTYDNNNNNLSLVFENSGQTALGSNTTNYTLTYTGSDYWYDTTKGFVVNTVKDQDGYSNFKKLSGNIVIGTKEGAAAPIEGTDYTYDTSKGLTILTEKDMIVADNGTSKTTFNLPINVKEGVAANLTLRDLKVVRNGSGSAVSVSPAADKTATINISGTVTLTAGNAYPAIAKNGEGTLKITGTGSLTANAGSANAGSAAGIGGGTANPVECVKNIIIDGPTVEANGTTATTTSYLGSAGIGSAAGSNAENIVIKSGTVIATAGAGAAGIGSGANGDADKISVAGGTVVATSMDGADADGKAQGGAGIGSGSNGKATNITISGGTVTANGKKGGAGIGSGAYANVDTLTISGGTITKAEGVNGGAGIGSGTKGNANNISITAGTITSAVAGTDAAGIGSGANGNAKNIIISGGTITSATGSDNGAGIGSGKDGKATNITISKGNVTASSSDNSAAIGSGINGVVSNLTISGGTVNASAGTYGAAIGSGSAAKADLITISGGTVVASAAHGAAIGSGNEADATNINITGGKVTATTTAKGAGIGAGSKGIASNISVLSDEAVVAKSANTVGIGSGYDATTTAKNVIVIGDKITGEVSNVPTLGVKKSDGTIIEPINSLYIIGKNTNFYGKASIIKDCDIEASSISTIDETDIITIPEGITLTVKDGGTLKLAGESLLNVNGTLDVVGDLVMGTTSTENKMTLIVNGTLKLSKSFVCYGTIWNFGTIDPLSNVTGTTVKDGEQGVVVNVETEGLGSYKAPFTMIGDVMLVPNASYGTGNFKFTEIKGDTNYVLADILADGVSVIDKATNSDKGYSYTYKYVETKKTHTLKFVFESQVTSLKITANPTKTWYMAGDKLDTTGFTASKVYATGTEIPLTEDEIKNNITFSSIKTSSGVETITVSYNGDDANKTLTGTFNVNVKAYPGLGTIYYNDNEVDAVISEEKRTVDFEIESATALNESVFDNVVLTLKEGRIKVTPTYVATKSNDYKAVFNVVVGLTGDSDPVSTVYTVTITRPEPAKTIDSSYSVTVNKSFDYTGKMVNLTKNDVTFKDPNGDIIDSDLYSINITAGGINAGTATVTVTGDGKKYSDTSSCTGTFTINPIKYTVLATPIGVLYDEGKEILAPLSVTVKDVEGKVVPATNYTVSYTSKDKSIVSIITEDDNYSAKFKGVKGSTEITATVTPKNAGNYNTTTYDISASVVEQTTVKIPESDSMKLSEKDTNKTITATILPAGATDGTITWSSSKTDVATIDASTGVITPIKAGWTIITAELANGSKATCTLTVNDDTAKTTISIDQTLILTVGDKKTLTVTKDPTDASETVTWSVVSTDKTIVTVDANTGEITALKAGSATVRATLSNGEYAECEITVNDKPVVVTPATVSIDKTLTLTAGESKTLVATVNPSTAKDTKTWSSSNTKVATVDNNGKVTAIAAGTATITVKLSSGKSASCTVTVKAKPVVVKPGDTTNDTKTNATVVVSDTTKKEVTYSAPVNKTAATVTIPASVTVNGVAYKVTKVSNNAFKGNTAVTTVKVPDTVTEIGSNAFSGCKNLKTVTIGKQVSKVGDGAFTNCASITTVKIPAATKVIGKNAFKGCKKLKTVTIGSNVTEIGANAFSGCTSITKIVIPAKVTKIGATAFNGCKKLKTLQVKSTKLTDKTVAKKAFKGIPNTATVKVPKKNVKAYKTLFKKKGLSSKVKVSA